MNFVEKYIKGDLKDYEKLKSQNKHLESSVTVLTNKNNDLESKVNEKSLLCLQYEEGSEKLRRELSEKNVELSTLKNVTNNLSSEKNN